MADQIALLFSGQGSQSVGMGRELCAAYPAAAAVYEEADAALGRPLTRLMTEGPLDELTRTANCQPALFVHGLATLAALRAEAGHFNIHAAAGLSLGEFTAHTAAGTFDFATGLKLVEARGQFMEDACAASTGSMAAIIGAEESVVRGLAADADVDIANLNCPGQIVISGEDERIMMAVSMAKQIGIRKAIPLQVAGAYHSRLMDPAYLKLGEALMHVVLQPAKFPVVANVTGEPAGDFDETRRTLTEQVTSTVNWTRCIEYLIDSLGCTLFLELGPDDKLAGMVNRIRKGTEVLTVSDPALLAKAVLRLKRA